MDRHRVLRVLVVNTQAQQAARLARCALHLKAICIMEISRALRVVGIHFAQAQFVKYCSKED